MDLVVKCKELLTLLSEKKYLPAFWLVLEMLSAFKTVFSAENHKYLEGQPTPIATTLDELTRDLKKQVEVCQMAPNGSKVGDEAMVLPLWPILKGIALILLKLI